MSLDIIVCVKQVMDPETPPSGFKIDQETKQVVQTTGSSPVLNGFDENAVEAALRIKDITPATITIVSVGKDFVMDVVKKPLAMGADNLILLSDTHFETLDSFATATVLAAGIRKLSEPDLILCGRQASDWDNAQVPLGLAEFLGLTCVTVAQKVDTDGTSLTIEQVSSDGYQEIMTTLPALVTVSNEIGVPRYPTLRGIMAAGRKEPVIYSAADLNIDPESLSPKVVVTDLYVPESNHEVEIISGEDDADAGRKLALRMREEGLI